MFESRRDSLSALMAAPDQERRVFSVSVDGVAMLIVLYDNVKQKEFFPEDLCE